jgi:hypothetical protein
MKDKKEYTGIWNVMYKTTSYTYFNIKLDKKLMDSSTQTSVHKTKTVGTQYDKTDIDEYEWCLITR